MARKTAKRQRRSRKQKKQRRHSKKHGGMWPFTSKVVPVVEPKVAIAQPKDANVFYTTDEIKTTDNPVATPVTIPVAYGTLEAPGIPEAEVLECKRKEIYENLTGMVINIKDLSSDNIFLYLYRKINSLSNDKKCEYECKNKIDENGVNDCNTKTEKIYGENYENCRGTLEEIVQALKVIRDEHSKNIKTIVDYYKELCKDEDDITLFNTLTTLLEEINIFNIDKPKANNLYLMRILSQNILYCIGNYYRPKPNPNNVTPKKKSYWPF